MPDPADKPAKSGVGDKTSQRCIGCGELYSSESAIKHENCNYTMAQFQAAAGPEPDRTIVYAESNVEKSNPQGDSSSAKRKVGEPNWPDEVKAAAKDPKNLLNQYILVAQIGKGGMGTVWKAFDRSLLRWVAIKFLTSVDGNEEGVARFKREAQLAGGLRHPNIAPIYEVGEARGQHFIAMEFIDGASMSNAQLPMKEILDIFVKVAQGIEAAHKKGVIHRDLKPQNIMLTSDNWPYVMDFGLAKALRGDSSLSVTGAVMGTPAYMPPEQAQGKLELIDHQSDVYSLGATMYAILSRKTPFQAETAMDILMKVCNEEPVPPRKHNPEIPSDIETIILKAMQKKKEDRYSSSQALADDLKRFIANEEIEATRPGFMTHIVRKAKRHKSAFVAGAVVLVAAIVVVAVVLPRGRKNDGNFGGGLSGEDEDARKLREKWQEDWQKMKLELGFREWKPGQNPKLAETAAAHLKEMPKLRNDAIDTLVIQWFQNEVEKARDAVDKVYQDSNAWTKNRDRVIQWQNWCDQLSILSGGYDLLKKPAESLGPIREEAAKISGFKGTFSLVVTVGPYADIELKLAGNAVPLSVEPATPFRMDGIPVGDYVLVLKHKDFGTFEVPLTRLEAGQTYVVTGTWQDKSFKFAKKK
ncbi:MAG TPA: serine/threonine-protein kinase [Planctomycetota bacterium]|nr:serine/threonine-protein kinase [Planctomycetota bacterium]